MSLGEKIKSSAEWLEHGKIIVEIFLALGGGTVVRAALNGFTKMSQVWITPAWLLSTALILGLLIRYFKPRRELSQSVAQTGISVAAQSPPPVNFNAADYFRTSYKSEMTAEVEKNIKVIANQNKPNDREGFLAYFIGVGLMAYLHDITWAYIFKSQILMLSGMTRNNGWLALSGAKRYYDSAVTQFPETYRNYSCHQWLHFLIEHQLIIRHPSDMLEITTRGKDFLKYLTHWGRSADDRKY